MWRTEKKEFAEAPQPAMSLGSAIIACAARNKAAHAVPDNDEFLHRRRPLLDQDFQEIGKRASIGGNMQPAVVVQINRRVAQIARQGGAVIVAVSFPPQIAHAQAVHQHGDAARQRHNGFSEPFLFEAQGLTVLAQAHGDRKWIGGLRKMIAHHAVQGCARAASSRGVEGSTGKKGSSAPSVASTPAPVKRVMPRMLL